MLKHSIVMQFKPASTSANNPGSVVTLIFETDNALLSSEKIKATFIQNFSFCIEDGKAHGRTNAADIVTRALDRTDKELGTTSWAIQAMAFASFQLGQEGFT